MTKPALKPQTMLSAEGQAFAEAAERGVLLLRKCNACGAVHVYPRAHCPLCGSRDLGWQDAEGVGTIWSYTVMEGAKRAIAPAMIDLPEGLRVTSTILDADVQRIGIGDPVQVRFQPDRGGALRLAFTTPDAVEARAYSDRAFAMVTADRDRFASGQTPAAIKNVAVIGAGNMGQGIATAFLKAGIAVLMIDQSSGALDGARDKITATLMRDVERRRSNAEAMNATLEMLEGSTDMARVGEADLVVEAVWEQMELKKEIFAKLDAHARPGVCLCSNTSTLDIDEIASATGRPDKVVGMHFFNPAHVMKLLEIVRGKATSEDTLALAMAVGDQMGKTAVVVGNAYGFVGNRLMIARERQAAELLLDGALPHQVDGVLTRFGMPMGTFEMQDMAGGIELSYRSRQAKGEPHPIIDRLFDAGRLGQKTGKGYYKYASGKRRPLIDLEVTAIIEVASEAEGRERRSIPDQDIQDRLILPMINEGAKLVADAIAQRPSDIDVVWQTGFGWPSWKGGPMYHADRLGLEVVVNRLDQLADTLGDAFVPAPLLRDMAKAGQRFVDLSFNSEAV